MDDDHSQHRAHPYDPQVRGATRSRRRILQVFAGAALIPVIGCSSDGVTPGTDAGTDTSGESDSAADSATDSGSATVIDRGNSTCSTIPRETGGPFPGDGTNGANALALAGIVRRDIRSSVGPATGVAPGVLLTVTLTLVNASAQCAPLAAHAIYIWQCDRDANYSMYSAAVANENFLRGVQETDAEGRVTFTTIFPAAYLGRWPHIHFEVYRSLATATVGANALRTSQFAFPEDACDEVYATDGYASSARNLARITLATDGVFRDGSTLQVASVTGDVTAGLVANLVVAIQA